MKPTRAQVAAINRYFKTQVGHGYICTGSSKKRHPPKVGRITNITQNTIMRQCPVFACKKQWGFQVDDIMKKAIKNNCELAKTATSS